MLHYQYRFSTAIHISVIVIACRHHPVNGTEQRGVLQEILIGSLTDVEIHLGGIPLRLGGTAYLIQLVNTLELYLLVVQLIFYLLQIGSIHADQLLAFRHAVAHLHKDAVYTHRRRGSNIVFYFGFHRSGVFLNLFHGTGRHLGQFHPRLFVHLLSSSFITTSATCPQHGNNQQGHPLKTFFHIVVLISILHS